MALGSASSRPPTMATKWRRSSRPPWEWASGRVCRSLPASSTFCVRSRLLVVLDNCEHLLDAASDLAGTVGKDCRHVCVIATSREPLEVPGEHVVRVRSLPVPDAAAVEWSTIEQSDCVRLFCQRAAATGSTFALSGANART